MVFKIGTPVNGAVLHEVGGKAVRMQTIRVKRAKYRNILSVDLIFYDVIINLRNLTPTTSVNKDQIKIVSDVCSLMPKRNSDEFIDKKQKSFLKI